MADPITGQFSGWERTTQTPAAMTPEAQEIINNFLTQYRKMPTVYNQQENQLQTAANKFLADYGTATSKYTGALTDIGTSDRLTPYDVSLGGGQPVSFVPKSQLQTSQLLADLAANTYGAEGDLAKQALGLAEKYPTGWGDVQTYNMMAPLFSEQENLRYSIPTRLEEADYDVPWTQEVADILDLIDSGTGAWNSITDLLGLGSANNNYGLIDLGKDIVGGAKSITDFLGLTSSVPSAVDALSSGSVIGPATWNMITGGVPMGSIGAGTAAGGSAALSAGELAALEDFYAGSAPSWMTSGMDVAGGGLAASGPGSILSGASPYSVGTGTAAGGSVALSPEALSALEDFYVANPTTPAAGGLTGAFTGASPSLASTVGAFGIPTAGFLLGTELIKALNPEDPSLTARHELEVMDEARMQEQLGNMEFVQQYGYDPLAYATSSEFSSAKIADIDEQLKRSELEGKTGGNTLSDADVQALERQKDNLSNLSSNQSSYTTKYQTYLNSLPEGADKETYKRYFEYYAQPMAINGIMNWYARNNRTWNADAWFQYALQQAQNKIAGVERTPLPSYLIESGSQPLFDAPSLLDAIKQAFGGGSTEENPMRFAT